MIEKVLTKERWKEILEERHDLIVTMRECYNSEEGKRRTDSIRAEIKELEEEYYNGLPVIAMGQCPFCKKVFKNAYDPFGISGLWWRLRQADYIKESCEHYFLLCGAVNLNGLPIEKVYSVSFSYIGTDVPYIYPEILDEEEKRCAVISQVEMENGYTIYPIVYFGDPPKKYGRFPPQWGYNNYQYFYPDKGSEWESSGNPWHFDIKPWVDNGKVLWCDPGTDRTKLSTKSKKECPFVDMPGKRQMLHASVEGSFYRDSYR